MVSLTLFCVDYKYNHFMQKVYTSSGTILVQADAWALFAEQYKWIEAAGGLIINTVTDDILFIHRNQRWDLPKGKQEPGESIEQTALREVQEECGIPSPELGALICETYHTYRIEDLPILKKTSWFRMSLSADQIAHLELKPQIEEGIEKVVWVSRQEAKSLAESSYGTITDVLNAFLSTKD